MNDDLSRLVFEALGGASMCWDPRPTGVFQSEEAIEIAERLLKAIRDGAE